MNRKGFTLIELLIVVVIIGILAAIAIPKFANTKEKAYLASMKSDLRNLVTAEEAYFADSVKYTSNLGTAYNTTSGVVGPNITDEDLRDLRGFDVDRSGHQGRRAEVRLRR
jgi:type IV pilus assembly protein PilA